MSSLCCRMPRLTSLKPSTLILSDSLLNKQTSAKQNSSVSYSSYGLKEQKEYEGDLNLISSLADLKEKVTQLRKEFPVCNVIKSEMKYFQGKIASSFEFKTRSNVIKLNVVTHIEMNDNLKAYFEIVLDEHYNCVLNGFKSVQDLCHQNL